MPYLDFPEIASLAINSDPGSEDNSTSGIGDNIDNSLEGDSDGDDFIGHLWPCTFPIYSINMHRITCQSCTEIWEEEGFDASWEAFQDYVKDGVVTARMLDPSKLATANVHLDHVFDTARVFPCDNFLEREFGELIFNWKNGLKAIGYDTQQEYQICIFRNCDKWSDRDSRLQAPVSLASVSGPTIDRYGYSMGTPTSISRMGTLSQALGIEPGFGTKKEEFWATFHELESRQKGGWSMWGESPAP